MKEKPGQQDKDVQEGSGLKTAGTDGEITAGSCNKNFMIVVVNPINDNFLLLLLDLLHCVGFRIKCSLYMLSFAYLYVTWNVLNQCYQVVPFFCDWMSKSRGAFIEGRNILDVPLTANEVVHLSLRLNSRTPFVR